MNETKPPSSQSCSSSVVRWVGGAREVSANDGGKSENESSRTENLRGLERRGFEAGGGKRVCREVLRVSGLGWKEVLEVRGGEGEEVKSIKGGGSTRGGGTNNDENGEVDTICSGTKVSILPKRYSVAIA